MLALLGCTYLHIPKTAGTALKNIALETKLPFRIPSHNVTLIAADKVIFSLRDPWSRFASGFWEAKTFSLRKIIGSAPEYKKYLRGGYRPVTERTQLEQEAYEIETPNAFVDWLREDQDRRDEFYQRPMDERTRPLSLLTESLTWWIGDMDTYLDLEHKVTAVFDQMHLKRIMLEHAGITMPEDLFISRDRRLFEFSMDSTCTAENLRWFCEEFRSNDYRLIDYIKTRPYFIA